MLLRRRLWHGMATIWLLAEQNLNLRLERSEHSLQSEETRGELSLPLRSCSRRTRVGYTHAGPRCRHPVVHVVHLGTRAVVPPRSGRSAKTSSLLLQHAES